MADTNHAGTGSCPATSRTELKALVVCICGFFLTLTVCLATASLPGCSRASGANTPSAPRKEKPLSVKVVEPLRRTVPRYFDYIGTTDSIHKVDIVARVKGYLEERHFKEGDVVKKDQLLYVIERRQYEAALGEASGQLDESVARAWDARLEEKRYKELLQRKSTSQAEYDTRAARAAAADARVELDRATQRNAQINLSYCSVYSPIEGQIGLTRWHVGNLVGADGDTLLATVVQLDPIYVFFSPGLQRYREVLTRLNKQEKIEISVKLGGQDEFYPHKGVIDFINNEVNVTTSTIKLRATLPNPEMIVRPGTYVEVRLWLGEIRDALLVPSVAIVERQVGQTVMIVGKDNKVETRVITTGPEYGKLRVVETGLKGDERILTERLLEIRAGMTITPVTAKIDPDDLGLGTHPKKETEAQ